MIRVFELQRAGFERGNRVLEAEEFCNRWKKDVYVFCKTFIGDRAAEEDATCEVLLASWRQRSYGKQDAIRAQIMRMALKIAEVYKDRPSFALQGGSRLEAAILDLPDKERAVVIMRSLLRMDWASLTLATALSCEEVHALWTRGVNHLNEILRQNLSNEQH